jgi:hypothetical protein
MAAYLMCWLQEPICEEVEVLHQLDADFHLRLGHRDAII